MRWRRRRGLGLPPPWTMGINHIAGAVRCRAAGLGNASALSQRANPFCIARPDGSPGYQDADAITFEFIVLRKNY